MHCDINKPVLCPLWKEVFPSWFKSFNSITAASWAERIPQSALRASSNFLPHRPVWAFPHWSLPCLPIGSSLLFTNIQWYWCFHIGQVTLQQQQPQKGKQASVLHRINHRWRATNLGVEACLSKRFSIGLNTYPYSRNGYIEERSLKSEQDWGPKGDCPECRKPLSKAGDGT